MALSPFDIIKSGVKSFFDKGKNFVNAPDNSKQGIAKNTILGLPKATATVAKDIAQGTARGIATIGQTAQNVIQTGKFESTVKPQQSPVSDIMYGTREPFSATSEGKPLANLVGAKPGSNAEKVVAPFIGFTMPLLDAIPGGSGAKKSLTTLARISDPAIVKQELKAFGLADDVIESITPRIASTRSTKEIDNILRDSVAPREIQEKAMELETRRQALEESPFNRSDLKVLNNIKEGGIRELGDIKNPALVRKIEDMMAETGIKDPTEFARRVEDFNIQKKRLVDDENFLRAEMGKVRTPERIPVPKEDFRTPNGLQARPLENAVKESLPQDARVNLIDYARTPDRVIEKLGLKKQMQNLRYAHENYLKEFQGEVNKINAWKKSLPKESSKRLFQYLDGKDIKLSPQEQKIAGEIREELNRWADKLGLPEEKRITNYITRIFDDKTGEIDADLAFILKEKLPKGVFNPFELERTGATGYVEDVWRALDAYVSKATRKVNLDQAIRDFDVAESLQDAEWDYVKNFLDGINFRPTKLDKLMDNTINGVLSKLGKTGEKISNKLGERPTKKILSPLRAMGYRGTLGANIGSALKNLSQGINTIGVLGEKNAFKGYVAMFSKKNAQELVDEGVLNYGFIQDRLSDTAPEWAKKMDTGLFKFFEDAERINRGAAYFGAKSKALSEGKSAQEAIEYAKEIVRKTQFQFGELDTPAFLRSDLAKTVFQLQSFTIKQVEFLTEMALKDKNFAGMLRYAVYGYLFVNTIGQLFDMEMKDLVPSLRLEGGLVFKPIIEGTKSILGTKDKYGNERTPKERVTDFTKTLLPFVPAGSQIKKTVEGFEAIKEGSKNESGETQFSIPEDDRLGRAKSVLFGKYTTKQGQEYVDSGFRNQGKTQEMLNKEVYDKLQSGEFGSVEVAKEYYIDELKKIKERKASDRMALPENEYKAALSEAIESGDITVEQAKKEYAKYEEQSAPEIERKAPELAFDYAKAFTKDPANALRAFLTKEKLGKVEGNLVELQRFYGIKFNAKGGSQDYKKERMFEKGIPWAEREDYALEHIVPVSAGGSNSDENLDVIDKATHDLYTPVDIAVGEAVKKGIINRRRAAKLMRDLKVEKTISIEDVIEAIK